LAGAGIKDILQNGVIWQGRIKWNRFDEENMRAENKLESHCRQIIQKVAVMQRSWMQSAVKPQ